MKKTEQIKLQLLAKDFKDAEYINCQDCAISKAAKRLFIDADRVGEGVNYLRVYYPNLDFEHYWHRTYGAKEFNKDQKLATSLPDDSLIKTLILKRRV